MTRILCFVPLGAGFFSSVEARAGEERWFGHYMTGTVPGYEVLELELLAGDFYGLQHQGSL